jgi:hypothetical protein
MVMIKLEGSTLLSRTRTTLTILTSLLTSDIINLFASLILINKMAAPTSSDLQMVPQNQLDILNIKAWSTGSLISSIRSPSTIKMTRTSLQELLCVCMENVK